MLTPEAAQPESKIKRPALHRMDFTGRIRRLTWLSDRETIGLGMILVQ